MHECGKSCINSIEIGRAALRIALTSSRVEETKVKERLAEHGIRSTAVDFGGAAHEALEQVKVKAFGFNVGGKIGIARAGEHLCVAIYMGVGVLNLNELCVGLAHRSLASDE